MPPEQPVVVIGLDGATWRLLDRWIEAGELPTLEQIKSESTSSQLKSCLPPVTSPNWKCYTTGKNPGKLGVYWWEIVDVAEKRISIPDSRSFQSPELWDYLGDAGHAWAAMNMPTTFPPHGDENGGLMIAGPNSEAEKAYTAPSTLKETLEERFGYKPGPEYRIDQDGALGEIYDMINMRFEVAKWLLETRDFDFFHLTTFLTNKLHHYYWDGPETKEGWKRIDKHLGWFLDNEYDLLFLSDHGSNKIQTQFQVNAWLEEEGYLVRESDQSIAAETGSQLGLTQERLSDFAAKLNLREVARSALPDRFINLFPQRGYKKGKKIEAIDWNSSQALASGQGLIYLTHPTEPGSEKIQTELITKLKSLSDPAGRPVASNVYTCDEIYWGDQMDCAPDIVFDQAKGIHTEDQVGQIETFEDPSGWRGENERYGIFMAHGPSFATERDIPMPTITDLAPTILHLLDVPIPSDLDGSLINVYAQGSEPDVRDVTYQSSRPTPSRRGGDLTEAEHRLRELGYLN